MELQGAGTTVVAMTTSAETPLCIVSALVQRRSTAVLLRMAAPDRRHGLNPASAVLGLDGGASQAGHQLSEKRRSSVEPLFDAIHPHKFLKDRRLRATGTEVSNVEREGLVSQWDPDRPPLALDIAIPFDTRHCEDHLPEVVEQ